MKSGNTLYHEVDLLYTYYYSVLVVQFVNVVMSLFKRRSTVIGECGRHGDLVRKAAMRALGLEGELVTTLHLKRGEHGVEEDSSKM